MGLGLLTTTSDLTEVPDQSTLIGHIWVVGESFKLPFKGKPMTKLMS